MESAPRCPAARVSLERGGPSLVWDLVSLPVNSLLLMRLIIQGRLVQSPLCGHSLHQPPPLLPDAAGVESRLLVNVTLSRIQHRAQTMAWTFRLGEMGWSSQRPRVGPQIPRPRFRTAELPSRLDPMLCFLFP